MTERVLDDVNISSLDLLPTPRALRERYPTSDLAQETVLSQRNQVKRIMTRQDPRVLIVVGPCSIHDVDCALDYARRLRELAEELQDTMLLLMRVYFEKPRTSVGWKGLINDPRLDDSFRIDEGLSTARQLLLAISEIGLGVGTEALDPITPQYLGDLVSWVAIGARTTESQTHRDMASGLSAPVGFKNGTDGNIAVAVNALKAVTQPQHFLGVTIEGQCAVFHTRGNRYGHLVLRGGGSRPNYDSVSVAMCEQALEQAELSANIVIDCSHGNSFKDHNLQPLVLRNCVNQIRDGNQSVIGFMLESHLEAGQQKIGADPSKLRRGVSVTDACIDWTTTQAVLREARERLLDVLPQRKAELRTPPPSEVLKDEQA